MSRSQRRVVENMNVFINEDIKPDKNKRVSSKLRTSASSSLSTTKKNLNVNEWMKTQPNTNAVQLIRHVLSNNTCMKINK